ncbi:MAG: hypothetical protein ACW99J_19290 [Candidatus Thorarchaeota archaeon]|jgi:hypothetical protein
MSDEIDWAWEDLRQDWLWGKLWARTWKQVAKKWFHRGEVAEGLLIVAELALRKQRTTATRRLGLLRMVSKSWWLPEICCEDNDEACDDCKLLRELAAELEGSDG